MHAWIFLFVVRFFWKKNFWNTSIFIFLLRELFDPRWNIGQITSTLTKRKQCFFLWKWHNCKLCQICNSSGDKIVIFIFFLKNKFFSYFVLLYIFIILYLVYLSFFLSLFFCNTFLAPFFFFTLFCRIFFFFTLWTYITLHLTCLYHYFCFYLYFFVIFFFTLFFLKN